MRSNSSPCPCYLFLSHKTSGDPVFPSSNSDQILCPLHHLDDSSTNSRSEKDGCVSSSSEDKTVNGEADNGVSERGNEQTGKVGDSSLTSDQFDDLEAAMFLRVYFAFLDYDLVKQHLNRLSCAKYLTWVSLIDCCYEKGKSDIVSSLLSDRQTNAAIDYLRSGILMHPQALIGHLYRLFQYTPSKAAEFCSEVRSSITALEIVAMCILADKSPVDSFLRYLKKFIIDLPFFQRPSEFGVLCESPVIRFLLLHALLPSMGVSSKRENAKKDVQDLAASVISVLPADWLEQILSRVTSPDEQDLVLHLCLTLRKWKPCIQLMSKGDDKKPLIDLLVTVGDMDLISKQGYLPQTTEEWRMLLSSFLQTQHKNNTETHAMLAEEDQQNTETSDSDNTTSVITENVESPCTVDNSICKTGDATELEVRVEKNHNEDAGVDNKSEEVESRSTATKPEVDSSVKDSPLSSPASPMTWESLTTLLVRHLGGAAAVEMLCQQLCSVEGGGRADGSGQQSLDSQVALTSSLFEACLSDYSIEAEQNQVCHEMLERLSVYMWAKKSGFLPPSVGHAIRAETKSRDGGPQVLEEDLACDRQISLLQSTTSHVLMSENFGVHWGQQVDMKQTCQSCQMPLRLIISHDVPGVVLFPCGDAFHKRCCADSFCPILH